MSWQWQYPRDPAPGFCDGGTWVECCTTREGLTDCRITPLGAWTPWAGVQLTMRIPDDDSEPGSIERLLVAANNLPTPRDVIGAVTDRIPTAEGLVPDVNVNLPESLGLVALLPAALFGLVVGGGIAWVVKK
jgi:hypothetical protein